MADRLIRVGRVSKIDYDNGMVAVTYPDLDDSVTSFLSVVSFNDEYKMPEVGDEVLVVHLSSGQSRGLVLGHYWNKTNLSEHTGPGVYRKEFGHSYGEAYMDYDGELEIYAPSIRLSTAAGSITVAEIIALRDQISSLAGRVAAVEAKV